MRCTNEMQSSHRAASAGTLEDCRSPNGQSWAGTGTQAHTHTHHTYTHTHTQTPHTEQQLFTSIYNPEGAFIVTHCPERVCVFRGAWLKCNTTVGTCLWHTPA